MNVQLEIEKLANQLEILKTQVQQQNGIRAGTQAVENHPRTSKSWTPIDSILGSPKMSMTELQSIRGDEDTDEDLERLLETVKEICGDEQDDLRNILETIDDIVISSQDTMRNEPFTLKSLLPSNKIIGHSKKSYNRTHPTKATLNSISSTSFVKPTLANDGNIPKPVYIPAKPQINVPSNRQRNVIKDSDASMIARRYLYGKGLKSPPSTIHTTSEKTVMEMSMVSQDYLRRHNLDTQHDETQFLDIKRINQLPKLPHLC